MLNKNSNYRYIVLISAVCVQICLGATYSWAIYVEPLKEILGASQTKAQLPFSLFYNFFPLTLLFAGFILERYGAKICTITGMALFSAAWMISGIFGANITMLSLLIGVLGGVGVGIVYMIPIKKCVQWFPHQKGLVTGIAVAGFGGGSALISQLGRYLMEVRGYTPYDVFKVLGVAFLLIGGVCGMFLKPPAHEKHAVPPILKIRDIVRNKMFRLLFFAMVAGLFGGFAIISNLKQVYKEATPFMGAAALSLFAIFNALGRIIWGGIYDKTGGKHIIFINLIFQAATLSFEPFFVKSSSTYYIFAAAAGFNYGGVLVIYASEVSHIWGASRLPKIYGWIFSANIIGSLSPLFAGFIYDLSGSFDWAFFIISGYIIITAAITLSIYDKVKGEAKFLL